MDSRQLIKQVNKHGKQYVLNVAMLEAVNQGSCPTLQHYRIAKSTISLAICLCAIDISITYQMRQFQRLRRRIKHKLRRLLKLLNLRMGKHE